MINRKDKSRGVVKGGPSGFMISLAVHAFAFLLAGMLVVFNVVQKEEKKFVPPKPVDRPKMKLKKPKVKVKKSSRPKATQRIVTKVQKASMPDIQLPEMSGIGEGLAGDIGGFDMAPDLGEVTIFGSGQSIGSDFVGTFYDLKRDRRGGLIPMSEDQCRTEIEHFVRGGWKKSRLARYYRSPRTLYATCFMVPPVLSSLAPRAFNEPDTTGYAWLVHYKGQLVHNEEIRFRFRGYADDVMLVRVNDEIVLDASHENQIGRLGHTWQSRSADDRKYYMGSGLSAVGDWITLEPGVPLDMEVLISEIPGGTFCAMLAVEVDGVEYERSRQGAPILPMFKTSPVTASLMDVISEHLVEGEAALTGGPIFCDYETSEKPEQKVGAAVEPSVEAGPEKRTAFRMWSLADGKVLEAEYLSSVAGYAVFRDAKGRQKKVKLDTLSAADREYIDLEEAPDFKVEFIKKSDSVADRYKQAPKEIEWGIDPARVIDYTFGASVRQNNSTPYNHELQVEYYAVGQQMLDDRKYMLLDHKVSSFIPSAENDYSHRMLGDVIELMQFNKDEQMRGRKYAEYIVLLTDKRGEIIEYSTSAQWLWDNLERLREVPVGRYMDRNCQLVVPTGPKATRY